MSYDGAVVGMVDGGVVGGFDGVYVGDNDGSLLGLEVGMFVGPKMISGHPMVPLHSTVHDPSQ